MLWYIYVYQLKIDNNKSLNSLKGDQNNNIYIYIYIYIYNAMK